MAWLLEPVGSHNTDPFMEQDIKEKHMNACIVRHIDTKEFYKFTLGEKGEIIITDRKDYDLSKLIVSLVPLKEVQYLDNNYYVVLKGSYGE